MKIFKKLNKKISTILTVGVFTLVMGVLSGASASAWGPERTTFTMEKPATYPTFNSITDNPTIGDERDFVRVGEINADVTNLKNEVKVVPGREYLVYIYFHNNASATFNTKEHNYSGVARVARMSSAFSKVLTPENRAAISATITADNSNPGSVWDEAYLTTDTEKVTLRYVAGSAKIYVDATRWKLNGSSVSTALFTEAGTLLGLNDFNGVIPGCEEYHGVVTYVLKAEELSGTLEKKVAVNGGEYKEAVDVKPGDEVDFQLEIKNSGDQALTNVTIKDSLPDGLTLVPGSVKLFANDSTTPTDLSDNIIGTGYNLGTVGTGNTIYIRYKVKAKTEVECGTTRLTNSAKLTYDSDNSKIGDSKTSSADVNIVRDGDGCEPKEPEVPEDPTPGEEPKEPEIPENPVSEDPKPTDVPEELPKTGPAEIVLAAVIVLGLGIWGAYYIHTNKNLKRVKASVMNGASDHGKDKNISQNE